MGKIDLAVLLYVGSVMIIVGVFCFLTCIKRDTALLPSVPQGCDKSGEETEV